MHPITTCRASWEQASARIKQLWQNAQKDKSDTASHKFDVIIKQEDQVSDQFVKCWGTTFNTTQDYQVTVRQAQSLLDLAL
jgi:hypothetical protein